jgi:hypothetical protein
VTEQHIALQTHISDDFSKIKALELEEYYGYAFLGGVLQYHYCIISYLGVVRSLRLVKLPAPIFWSFDIASFNQLFY